MDYTFKAISFDGPLDLLLHLIKSSEMNIFEINVADITDQYLNYITKMEDMNLNISSEYLVMAADLIELKSRELLPKNENEDEEEDDPREELINRLVEYQKYKDICGDLRILEDERMKYFSKQQTFLEEYKSDEVSLSQDVSFDDLVKAFKKFLMGKELEKPLNTVVTKKEYSIQERSHEIMKKLKVNKSMKFSELFDVVTKDYVVVTFLSLLNLAKAGSLCLKQKNSMEEIVVEAREGR